ncbi:MAG: hypothetical protein PUG05_03495, partial [Galactobacillus timonensis]|nr:hypothetical protein [Galactobacillus timonensis]
MMDVPVRICLIVSMTFNVRTSRQLQPQRLARCRLRDLPPSAEWTVKGLITRPIKKRLSGRLITLLDSNILITEVGRGILSSVALLLILSMHFGICLIVSI